MGSGGENVTRRGPSRRIGLRKQKRTCLLFMGNRADARNFDSAPVRNKEKREKRPRKVPWKGSDPVLSPREAALLQFPVAKVHARADLTRHYPNLISRGSLSPTKERGRMRQGRAEGLLRDWRRDCLGLRRVSGKSAGRALFSAFFQLSRSGDSGHSIQDAPGQGIGNPAFGFAS